MPKADVLLVIDSQSSTRSNVGNFVLSTSSGGSSGGVSSAELSNYLRRDGTSIMMGNLDMGGFSVTNVSLLDGIDLPAHVANPDAHHVRMHALDSVDHTGLLPWGRLNFAGSELVDIEVRPHESLTDIGPDDHHPRVHNIVGSDHTVIGFTYDVVGLTANNTLGLLTPSSNPGASMRLLRTDENGLLIIKRLEGVDYIKSAAYIQAATYVTAGSYVSAITYVNTPLLQYAGNLSLTSGINIYLDPTGYISVGVATGKTIRTPSFVSGFLGDGWQIDQNISAPGTNAEFDNLTIRGRMRVYELIIQKIRATNGSIFVSSTGKAATVTLVGVNTYSITTEDDHGFFVNDLIRAQQFTGNVPNPLYRCDMRVLSVESLKAFTAIRENSSDIPKVGMDFVRLGNTTDVTRQGGLYLTSDDSNAPFMDVFDGINSWLAWTTTGKVKVRVGKITGVTSTANEYGLIAGFNGFGPTNSWIKVSNKGIILNNVPLQFFNGVAQTGYWGPDGTSFWVGVNTSNRKLEWNGTTLAVRGQITVEPGGNAATTADVSGAITTSTSYTNTYAPNKALSNTTAIWARGETLGGNAYDTQRVSGTLASTVLGYANRAAAGLSTDGRIVKSVQGPSISDNTTVTGLNLTSTHMGYFNGTYWTLFMKNDGTFRFGSTATNNRIEWNGSQLAGYNNAGAIQWYADSADGQIKAGGGAVLINSQGINAGTYTQLDANGLEVTRLSTTYTTTIEPPTTPVNYITFPTSNNTIDLKDSAFFISDWWGNTLNYTANSPLKLYTSSVHYVSSETYFDSQVWTHYVDGIIEVGPTSKPQRTINTTDPSGLYVNDYYYSRLFIRNRYTSMVMHETQQIDINSATVNFNLLDTVYANPALRAYLQINLTTTQQTIMSQNMLYLTSASNQMSLIASAMTIGNNNAPGLISLFSSNLDIYGRLRLRAQYSDILLLDFFARTATPAVRSATIGFPDPNSSLFWISNAVGSVIYMEASDKVQTSASLQVGKSLQLSKQSATPAAVANNVQIYMGGDGHVYLRGANGYARLTGFTVISGSFP